MTECTKIQFTKSTNHRIPYLFQISKLSSKPIKHNLQSIHANEPPRETFQYEIYPWIADLRMMRTTITRDCLMNPVTVSRLLFRNELRQHFRHQVFRVDPISEFLINPSPRPNRYRSTKFRPHYN